MARGLNKAMIIGHVGQDPDVSYTGNGSTLAKFSVATDEGYKDRSGQKIERTEWHRIAAFGKLAEIVGEYVRKGQMVYIEGKIRTNKWQDKQGQDRYTTEIIADQMQMLGGRDAPQERAQERPSKQAENRASAAAYADLSGADDDIPFAWALAVPAAGLLAAAIHAAASVPGLAS